MSAPALYADALAYARSRRVQLPADYYGARPLEARAWGFSVAGLASLDQVQGVLDALDDATASGASLEHWQKQVRGGSVALDLPPHRLDTLFRTNLQQAYGAGRDAQMQANNSRRPWRMYDAINDSRVRPAHLAMDNHIARYDDPIWATWTPPCGYACRCTLRALTDEQAARRTQGKPQTPPGVAPDTGWDYDRRTGWRESVKRAVQARTRRCQPGGFAPGGTPAWCAPGRVQDRLGVIEQRVAETSMENLDRELRKSLGADYDHALAELARRGATPQTDPHGLSGSEMVSLFIWTQDTAKTAWFRRINAQLRATSEHDAAVWPLIAAMTSAWRKLPPNPGPAYRGIKRAGLGEYARAFDADVQTGGRIRLPGMVSASADRYKPLPGEITLILRGHSGRQISRYSELPQQNEVLFLHGTEFAILRKEADGREVTIWLMEM